MKTKITLTLLTIAGLMSINAQTQNEMKPTVREVEEMHLVYYEFKGPYDQSYNDFGKLMQYVQSNNLAMGPHSAGIYYDDPEVVPAEELRSEIGHLTAKLEKTNGIYKTKTIPAGKAVSVKYKSMDEIYAAYAAVSGYIAENELETVSYSVEIYYSNDPAVIDAEILMFIKQ